MLNEFDEFTKGKFEGATIAEVPWGALMNYYFRTQDKYLKERIEAHSKKVGRKIPKYWISFHAIERYTQIFQGKSILQVIEEDVDEILRKGKRVGRNEYALDGIRVVVENNMVKTFVDKNNANYKRI